MAGVILGGLALGAVGQIMQGSAAASQAKGEQAMANYNAAVANQNAVQTEKATLYKQQKQAEAADRQASTLRANLGASGAVPNEGTALQLQGTQAAQSELDNLMIGYQGQIQAGQYRSQAGLQQMQAGIYGQAAGNDMMAGMLGAGTSLLTGFGQYGNRTGAFMSPPPKTQPFQFSNNGMGAAL
jgi:hypothetical protein